MRGSFYSSAVGQPQPDTPVVAADAIPSQFHGRTLQLVEELSLRFRQGPVDNANLFSRLDEDIVAHLHLWTKSVSDLLSLFDHLLGDNQPTAGLGRVPLASFRYLLVDCVDTMFSLLNKHPKHSVDRHVVSRRIQELLSPSNSVFFSDGRLKSALGIQELTREAIMSHAGECVRGG